MSANAQSLMDAGVRRAPREALVFVCRASGIRTEVLLVRRCNDLGGFWHAVAGGVEGDETDAEAALRELFEETGLDGRGRLATRRHRRSYALAGESPCETPAHSPATERVTVTCFRVDAPPNWQPRLNWEHDDYRWCQLDEAIELLHWPLVRRALIDLLG